jgi:ABC-type uncharacterized transport system substrate-binding protein
MKYRTLLITFLVVLGLSAPFTVIAHPHNWIDLRVEVRFNKDGRAVGLFQKWLFDDIYSVTITEGMDSDGDGLPDRARLDELHKSVVSNLKAHNYFTHVEHEGNGITFGPVSQGAMTMYGNRLEFSFYLPFATPLDPRRSPLNYRVFDPSYYIEMLHAESKDAVVLRAAPEGCSYRLQQPKPDPKQIAYAASLPPGADGGDLGRFFTEKIVVKCQN